MGPCKTMTDTLAPVERTNWALSAWNSTLDQNDVPSAWLYGQDHLWATGHLVSSPGGFMVRTICGQLVTSCLHLGVLWSGPSVGNWSPRIFTWGFYGQDHLWATGHLVSSPGGFMVRTICGQLVTSCLHLGVLWSGPSVGNWSPRVFTWGFYGQDHLWATGHLVSSPGGFMVRTICGQLVTSCLHLGVLWSGPSVGNWSPRVFTWGFLSPPSPPPLPTRPPPRNTGLKLMHTFKKIV